MMRKVKAVYDHGVLKLLERVDLPEHKKVTVVIVEDDVPTEELQELAVASGAFDFLSDSAEDIYTREDGDPV